MPNVQRSDTNMPKENLVCISYAWQEALEDMQRLREAMKSVEYKWIGRIHNPGERVSGLELLGVK